MPGIPQDDFDTMYNYFTQIFMRKGSSESALHSLFEYGIIPYTPIIDSLKDFKEQGIEVSFHYGTRDWMDTEFNGEKVSQILKEEGADVYMVDDADHHLYFDNPQEMMCRLNEDLLNSKAVKDQLASPNRGHYSFSF